jgi:YggT family protein
LQDLLCQLLQLYVVVVIARIILSWFPVSPGSGLSTVFSLLYAVTEPVLGPLRRVIPPLMIGGGGIDLSPIVLFFGIQILQSAICA